MFTPPASPQPNPGPGFAASQDSLPSQPRPSSKFLSPPPSSTPPHASSPSKADPGHQRSREDAKKRIGRRFRNAVILIPLVLVAITLTARMATHETPFFLSLASTFSPSSPCHEPHHHPHNLVPPHSDTSSTSTSISLEKRSPQLSGVGETTTGATRAATTTSTPTATTVPTVPQSSPVLPTPFPQAFSGIITKNFSSVSCMNFITDMANAREFRSCRPFSLLLESSDVFVSAQSNLTLLNELVWGTCNTNTPEDQCITNMATYATNLRTQCAEDLKDGNAVAVNALKGLESYALMRESGCLTDPTTNSYCFVSAAADTNPTNLYYYNLPIGIKLPSSANPQCNACLKSLMSLYAGAMKDPNTAKSLSGLQATYEKAAETTLGKCGAGYATANLVNAAMRAVGTGAVEMGTLVMGSVLVAWMSMAGL